MFTLISVLCCLRIGRASHSSATLYVSPPQEVFLFAVADCFPSQFVGAVGDSFSTYAIKNPDAASELKILQQLAPELSSELLSKLVAAFQDLRAVRLSPFLPSTVSNFPLLQEFAAGRLSYPFSLRELLALTRHIRRFPDEPLDQALRSIFDFDLHSSATLDALREVLRKHKLGNARVGIDAVRGEELSKEEKEAKVIEFEPTGSTELGGPKEGKHDNEEHSGGNTWAGGTGGRDTAGLGGRVRLSLVSPSFLPQLTV